LITVAETSAGGMYSVAILAVLGLGGYIYTLLVMADIRWVIKHCVI